MGLARKLLNCLSLLVASAVCGAFALAGESIQVTSKPVAFGGRIDPSAKVRFISGIEIMSPDARFGGFSGLEISASGKKLLAVSDDGWWLSVDLVYKNGKLTGLNNAILAPLLRANGKRPSSKTGRDAESLAAWDGRGLSGEVLVGFERATAIRRYDIARSGLDAPGHLIATPKAMAAGPRNGELEAAGRFWDGPRPGWLIAISENNLDPAGNVRAWMWQDKRTQPFSLKRLRDYAITGMAVVPGGREFVTIERHFSLTSLPGMALRRFKTDAIASGATIDGEVLFAGRRPFYTFDNMEGLALHIDSEKRLRATVISDDNYNRVLQKTMILQFIVLP